jgi:hypothetical protein
MNGNVVGNSKAPPFVLSLSKDLSIAFHHSAWEHRDYLFDEGRIASARCVNVEQQPARREDTSSVSRDD